MSSAESYCFFLRRKSAHADLITVRDGYDVEAAHQLARNTDETQARVLLLVGHVRRLYATVHGEEDRGTPPH